MKYYLGGNRSNNLAAELIFAKSNNVSGWVYSGINTTEFG